MFVTYYQNISFQFSCMQLCPSQNSHLYSSDFCLAISPVHSYSFVLLSFFSLHSLVLFLLFCSVLCCSVSLIVLRIKWLFLFSIKNLAKQDHVLLLISQKEQKSKLSRNSLLILPRLRPFGDLIFSPIKLNIWKWRFWLQLSQHDLNIYK